MSNVLMTRWVHIGLGNFTLIALMGVMMRYKIAFSLPMLDQKKMLLAHSTFAFAGWISLMLMSSIIYSLKDHFSAAKIKAINMYLMGYILSAFGLLVVSLWRGNDAFFYSLFLVHVTFFFLFGISIFKTNTTVSLPALPWFRAGILFYFFSIIGMAIISYVLLTKSFDQRKYLAAFYWFLHFQYNGWFLFASLGLLIHYFYTKNVETPLVRYTFLPLALSVVPTYGLSILWTNPTGVIFIIIAITTIIQFIVWLYLFHWFYKKSSIIPPVARYILLFSASALTIKFSLQLVSILPSISQLTVGFRPIVIAYLHLVLLACASVFLVGYFAMNKWLRESSMTQISLFHVLLGIALNELVLAVQGIFSFSYTVIPYLNEIIFGVSVYLFLSIATLFISNFKAYARG